MDSLPKPYAGQPLTPSAPAEHCEYCGAPLHPLLYFCPTCSTPYKSMETAVTPYIPRVLTDGELVQRDAPKVANLFWTYFGVVLCIGSFSALLDGKERPDLHLFLSDVAILFTTCIVGVIHRKAIIAQLGRFGFNQPAAWIGLAILFPMLGLNYVYHVLLIKPIVSGHADTPDEFARLREAVGSELVLIISFCVLPALTEEIAYRGLIQHWLQVAIKPWKAIVFASFLFAATHFSIVSFWYLFLVGCLLGWTKYRSGSLYPSMLIHFLHNLVVIEYFERHS